MKALVIGYGSIGQRHARLLTELGMQVSLVTAQNIDKFKSFKSLPNALLDDAFDHIVIANNTLLHYSSLKECLAHNHSGAILVEKPLFNSSTHAIDNYIDNILVAYNLRFHPCLQELRKIIAKKKLISINIYAGQYLPDWRPNVDYRNSYSASKVKGGGVLKDLSHELDYVHWLCGKCYALTAKGGHYGDLDIDSDDSFSIIMQCEHCPLVTIELSYLTRHPKREIIINTTDETFFVNLLIGTIKTGDKIIKHYNIDQDYTYIKQFEALLAKNYHNICSFVDGLYVLKLIEAIEQANLTSTWVYL